MKHKSDFHEFIGKHYGTQRRMANSLGVTPETVRSWIKTNPRGMLKYSPEIVKDKNVTASQILWEVVYREKELKNNA